MAITMSAISRKIDLYWRAALHLRSPNLRGLPLAPKRLFAQAPHNRSAFNEFVLWIRQLGLGKNTGVVLDVGANHGDFSQAASACFPAARVWLFEPLPALWPGLERHVARRAGRWNLQRYALGRSAAVLPLHVASGDDNIGSFIGFEESYLQRIPHAAEQSVNRIDCRVETLDGFLAQADIERVDLLKIDVEGFEFDVLAGGEEALRRTTAVVVEVSLIRQAKGRPDPVLEMVELLTRAGFYLLGVIPSFSSPHEVERPLEYNILARRF